MSRRHIGVALLVGALLLVAAAFFVWVSDSEEADKDQLAEEYRAAIDGGSPDDVDPDRVLPIAMGAAAGVLFLGGVVVLATSPSHDS